MEDLFIGWRKIKNWWYYFLTFYFWFSIIILIILIVVGTILYFKYISPNLDLIIDDENYVEGNPYHKYFVLSKKKNKWRIKKWKITNLEK